MQDLQNDLQDGLLLTSLVLKLTNRASTITAPHTAHPLSLENKIENVNFAFSLLEREKLKVIYTENGRLQKLNTIILLTDSFVQLQGK